VGPIFKQQILADRNITVTNSDMTRFFISKDAAVDLCIESCSALIGGEIFVSDMGAASIGAIAEEFQTHNPNINIIEIGAKAGEKLYEELFTDVESKRVYKFRNMYVILPDSLPKTSEQYLRLMTTYDRGEPIGIALKSDSEFAKVVDIAGLVRGIMNAVQ
jgi:FlaA1/EpsC-like NDP-sugar epimerase